MPRAPHDFDVKATWAIIVSPHSDPVERRDNALALLVWYATDLACDQQFIDACEAVIKAEFEFADRLAGR